MSDAYETLAIADQDGVRTITLNRPESLNAFNETMKSEVQDALKQAERHAETRCLVVTGAGRGFGSGQDLADLKGMYADGGAPDLGSMLRDGYNPIIERLRSLPKPVIAAVNGVAAGAGCSLALACDLRVATTKAVFVQAFVHVGLIPDCGGTFFLPRLVGLGRAMEMAMLGDKVTAEEALRVGLVNRVVEQDELMNVVREMATKMAAMPTKAMALTKRLLNQSYGNDLEDQLRAEAFAQATSAQTEDHLEGVRAFMEKRKPAFSGR